MKLRIKFKKYGPVRFIGHLDVMRFFQKAIRRAEIDVTYTEGFSPHQVMTFAAPLGVGLTSNGEYMDIEVNSLTSCEDVKKRLNAASVPGLDIVSVKILPEGAGNAMASVAAAAYTVRFREHRTGVSGEMAEAAEAALENFLSQENNSFHERDEKGVRQMDLKPGIFRLTFEDGAFHMLVDASSAGNIKPSQVMEALLAYCGKELPQNALLITRKEVYTCVTCEDGTADFLPLEAVGLEEEEEN